MKKFLTMIMIVLIALIAGCSDHKSTSNTDSEKVIDKIVLCESWDINGGFVPVFDPSEGWASFYYLGNFYETLVNYDNGKIKPGLAKSWEVDGNEITFNLREGVKFTDGTDFTAEVVKKNLEMIPELTGAERYASTFVVLSKLKEIKIVDQHIVKIILTEPYYGALQELSVVRPMGMMSLSAYTEEGLSEEVYSKTFGTGKYLIENAVKGQDYTFVRNENYWGEKPQVKQFVVKKIPDMESRIMALRTGEIDMIFGANNITYDAFFEFANDDKFTAKASESTVMTRCLLLNTTVKPLDDKKVRHALQYGIDKQAICDSLFYGVEEKADYLFNLDLPYCNVDLEPYDYDIEKARRVLNEAGWVETAGSSIREKDGKKLKIDLLYEAGAGIEEDLMLAVSAQLRELGFEVNLSGLEIMPCMGKVMSGDFMIYSSRTFGRPYEPYVDISNMNKNGLYNPAQQGLPEKKELDLKIDEVSLITEPDKIQESYNYILGILHDEAAYLPISYRKELVIYKQGKIKDYKFNEQPLNIDIAGIVPNAN